MKRSAANKKGGRVLPAVLGRGSSLKSLLLASLAGCIVIGAPSASATELSDVDLSKKPLDTPTLDYLNQNNVTLPAGDDGTAAPVPPSAYTLTKVDAAGENTITKFEWDESTQSYNVVNYQIDLKQTEYGEGNQTHTVTLENGPLKDVTINVHYDEPDISSGEYDNTYSGNTVNLEVTNPEGTSYNNPYQITGGAVKDADFSGNVLIENNILDVTLNVTNGTSSDRNYAYTEVLGGAIYNDGDIANITGAFVNNSVTTTINRNPTNYNYGYMDIYGGAIYNAGNIENIKADFINNSLGDGYDTYGGAIYNAGNAVIGNIEGNFINNTAAEGSAIFNNGKITSISGNFVNNTGDVIYNDYDAQGIDSITGNFINNTGGYDIYNFASGSSIGSIYGNFINSGGIYNNYISNIGSIAGTFIDSGIYNRGTINSVTANFYNNNGVSIYNDGNSAQSHIEYIQGDFIGNSGIAIHNHGGYIGAIVGDFIGNKNGAINSGVGSGIFYSPEIGYINGDFIENSAFEGGAIYNVGDISGFTKTNITYDVPADKVVYLNFSKETIVNPQTGEKFTYYRCSEEDLAMYKKSVSEGYKLVDHTENLGEYVPSDMDEYEEVISYIKQDIADGYSMAANPLDSFSENDFTKEYIDVDVIPAITGNFIGNHADNAGGAIYNQGGYSRNDGDFNGYIDTIKGIFIKNTSDGHGGAIANTSAVIANEYDSDSMTTASILSIESDFIQNSAKTAGGAIYNGGLGSTINKIKGDFTGNYVEGQNTQGGAIYNTVAWNEYNGYVSGNIGEISGTFAGNYAKSSSGDALGGAVYNEGHIDDYYNVSFIDNYAETSNGEAQGGAIYSKEDVNITADNYNSLFDGNYVKDSTGSNSNAIYMAPNVEVISQWHSGDYTTSSSTTTATDLNLRAENNGTITINDKINGIGTPEYIVNTTEREVGETYTDLSGNIIDSIPTEVANYGVNFTGDATGVIYLNNNIEADDYEHPETGEITEGRADVTLSDTTLHFGVRDDVLNNNNFTVNSGTWNMVNNQTGVSALNSFTVNGDTNFVADVDLQKEEMDRIESNSYGTHQGNLIVSGMNLLSDAPEGRDVTEIYFAEQGLKDYVQNGVSNGTGDLPDSNQTTFYTPIYKYNAVYDNRDDAGYFVFTKGDKIYTPTPGGDIPGGNTGGGGSITDTGNPSDAFNPAVLTTPVANQAASQAAMTEAFKYVFEHADAFTQLPATERMSYIRQNQYALSTDYNDNLGQLTPEFNNKAGWVRPYVTFENMHLKNGPKVDAITYGTLVGFDTDFQDLKRGWYGMTTGYVGYNGSQLSYSGVDGSTNGGLLGVTQTFYKGNFWTALTASAGASVGEAQTMYGSDDFTTLLAGVASKTGYNFEFKEGKFIIQPIMYISYTFANTFDYTNAAGVKIENNPMHTLQLHPQVRFIMNTENNWQPYISAGVVWNPFTSSKSTANGIVLPEMSMKPYAEYGVGVQKRWADKYTAFGQAMVRSGGRNGVALTFGFRWNIGKDSTKQNENEQVYKPERKVIKQARK